MKKTKTITGIRRLVIKTFTLLLIVSFGSSNIWAITCPCTSPLFTLVNTYPKDGIAEGIATGDFNNDSKLDLITADRSTNKVTVALGIGSGNFGTPTSFPIPINGTAPFDVVVADFDQDTYLDFATANRDSANITVGYGNGTGQSFSMANHLTYKDQEASASPRRLVTGYFNEARNSEGRKIDIATCNGEGTVSVFVNVGGRVFNKNNNVSVTTGRLDSIKSADFDSDFWDDLVTTEFTVINNPIHVLRNNHLSGWTQLHPELATATAVPASVTGDFDNDGLKDDLAVGRVTHVPYGYITVLLGDSNGNLLETYSSVIDGDYKGGTLSTGDFNLDGKLDIAAAGGSLVGSSPSPSVFFYLNQGNQISERIGFSVGGGNPAAVTVGDFNSDGKPDAASDAYASSNSIKVFLNTYNQNAIRKTDYNGDGRTDFAYWSPSTGVWNIKYSYFYTDTYSTFGTNGDIPVQGDYDGDKKTDTAVFRPSNSTWYIQRSQSGFLAVQWGTSGDKLVPGDYDGDCITDIAVFRPSNSTWYVLKSSNSSLLAVQYGTNGDIPVQGDYDGDGKTDIGVFRPSNSTWYVLSSQNGTLITLQWGTSGDKLVPGDYDGDCKTDIAVFRPDTFTWFINKSSNGGLLAFRFTDSTGIPQVGDYDGDGKTDAAMWESSSATWKVLPSSNATISPQTWGSSTDIYTSSAYPIQ